MPLASSGSRWRRVRRPSSEHIPHFASSSTRFRRTTNILRNHCFGLPWNASHRLRALASLPPYRSEYNEQRTFRRGLTGNTPTEGLGEIIYLPNARCLLWVDPTQSIPALRKARSPKRDSFPISTVPSRRKPERSNGTRKAKQKRKKKKKREEGERKQ